MQVYFCVFRGDDDLLLVRLIRRVISQNSYIRNNTESKAPNAAMSSCNDFLNRAHSLQVK